MKGVLLRYEGDKQYLISKLPTKMAKVQSEGDMAMF
jgi:hypothetical protein